MSVKKDIALTYDCKDSEKFHNCHMFCRFFIVDCLFAGHSLIARILNLFHKLLLFDVNTIIDECKDKSKVCRIRAHLIIILKKKKKSAGGRQITPH